MQKGFIIRHDLCSRLRHRCWQIVVAFLVDSTSEPCPPPVSPCTATCHRLPQSPSLPSQAREHASRTPCAPHGPSRSRRCSRHFRHRRSVAPASRSGARLRSGGLLLGRATRCLVLGRRTAPTLGESVAAHAGGPRGVGSVIVAANCVALSCRGTSLPNVGHCLASPIQHSPA